MKDHGLAIVAWICFLVAVLDMALVLAWIRGDRKRARERQQILDGLER